MNTKIRILAAEAIGTMILIVGGPGTAVIATGYFGGFRNSVTLLGVALAFGLSLLVANYAIGSISGCHINPAVTLGLWAIKKTKGGDVPFYLVGQLLGGVVGGFIIFVIARSSTTAWTANSTGFASNGYGAHSPGGFGLGAVIIAEIVFTAIFVFIVASTSRKSMSPGFSGVVVGLALVLIHLISIPIDNGSVNPVRSIATAIFQRGWALDQLWLFIVFPIIGGLLGAGAWKALSPAEEF